MKSNYVVRAIKFLNKIVPYLNKYNSVYTAISAFNFDNRRAVKVGRGAVRYALLTSDYVVKWDYDADNACTFGGCKEEYEIWKEVKNLFFEIYLQRLPLLRFAVKFIILCRELISWL